MMIGTVMFLGGFFASLLAFYGRNAPLLILAAVLFSFCWVGNERTYKACRLVPILLLTVLGIVLANKSCLCILDQHYFYTAIVCLLMVAFLLVSMLPTGSKMKPSSRVASFLISPPIPVYSGVSFYDGLF